MLFVEIINDLKRMYCAIENVLRRRVTARWRKWGEAISIANGIYWRGAAAAIDCALEPIHACINHFGEINYMLYILLLRLNQL